MKNVKSVSKMSNSSAKPYMAVMFRLPGEKTFEVMCVGPSIVSEPTSYTDFTGMEYRLEPISKSEFERLKRECEEENRKHNAA